MSSVKEILKKLSKLTGIMFFPQFFVWFAAFYTDTLIINNESAGFLDFLKGLSISLYICVFAALCLESALTFIKWVMVKYK